MEKLSYVIVVRGDNQTLLCNIGKAKRKRLRRKISTIASAVVLVLMLVSEAPEILIFVALVWFAISLLAGIAAKQDIISIHSSIIFISKPA